MCDLIFVPQNHVCLFVFLMVAAHVLSPVAALRLLTAVVSSVVEHGL